MTSADEPKVHASEPAAPRADDRLIEAAQALAEDALRPVRGYFSRLAESTAFKPTMPMGAAYQDLIRNIDRLQAQALLDATFPRSDWYDDHVEMNELPASVSAEVAVLEEVVAGVDRVTVAQERGAIAQERALEALRTAAELIGNLDATIRDGNRGSDRQARLALGVSIVAIVTTVALGWLTIIGWRP